MKPRNCGIEVGVSAQALKSRSGTSFDVPIPVNRCGGLRFGE